MGDPPEDLNGITVGDQPVERYLIKQKDIEGRRGRLDMIREQSQSRKRFRPKARMPPARGRSGRTRRLSRREINREYKEVIMQNINEKSSPATVFLACMLDGESWSYDTFAKARAEQGKNLGSGQFSTTMRGLIESMKPLVVREEGSKPYRYYLRQEALAIPLADLEALRKGKVTLHALSQKHPQLKDLTAAPEAPEAPAATVKAPDTERQSVDININLRIDLSDLLKLFGKG